MKSRFFLRVLLGSSATLALLGSSTSGQTVFLGAGPLAGNIQPIVDAYRAGLGGVNNGVGGSFATGRREINWDGVPDGFAAPNLLPANFFNANSARGVVMSTPGVGFQVSANAGVGPIEFGNFNPTFPTLFEPFSAQRLFTPIGSNITDVSFFIPGTATAAGTRGFGSVFSDVDVGNVTSIQFFDLENNSLGTFFAPPVPGANETFSFLGVIFADAIIGRVRITTGNQVLGVLGPITTEDLVVMDDWIYGEPQPRASTSVPENGISAMFLVLGLIALGVFRRNVSV